MIEKVYELISKTENARIVSTKEIVGKKSIKKYSQVISVETEVSLNEGLKTLLLYIVLEEPYSINLPKIFIDEKCYEDIKYIPHINSDLSICIIDENENFKYLAEDLPEITLKLLERVKEIIRSKNEEIELKSEFEREFSAYWDISYNEKETVSENGFCLIDFSNFQNIKAIRLLSNIGFYKYVVYNIEEQFLLFEKFLKTQNVKYEEITVFVAHYTKIAPPFRISYKESLKFLKDMPEFKNKINKLSPSEFIVVFKNNQDELFGWEFPFINKRMSGFRPMSNWQFLNSTLSNTEFVSRMRFSNISPKRLDIRTGGFEINRGLKAAIVGLGSVGSNLLHYLMKYPIAKYCLIDPDILKVENVFRHKYGFNYLSHFKTKISEYEILSKNPFTEVVTLEKKINNVFSKSSTLLEEYDFRFVVIGVSRIEKYIIEHFISITSNKPVILIWVEPYMASGQLIYLRPEDFQKGIDLINEYPYHVLKKNQNLSIREGSCQTGYMPYSDMHLNLFLSSLNVILYNLLINRNHTDSKVFSWIGNIDELKGLALEIEEKFDNHKFTIIENEFKK